MRCSIVAVFMRVYVCQPGIDDFARKIGHDENLKSLRYRHNGLGL